MKREAAKALPPLPASLHSRLAPLLRLVAEISPRMVQRHHEMAHDFFQQHLLWEAEHRWQWVLNLRPNHVQALIGLGWVWMLKERQREAAMLLQRALALQPQNPEARFLLAQATNCTQPPEQMPLTTPPRMIQRRYTLMAPTYDAIKMVEQRYRVPVEISKRVTRGLQALNEPNILDIGCGTGMFGEVHWRVGGRIEGVELVPAMLRQSRDRWRISDKEQRQRQEREQAHELNETNALPLAEKRVRPVYDALWNEDARDFLLRPRGAMFHAIVASDVFPEIGGLTPVFDGAVRNLLTNGILVCSTETGPDSGYAPFGKDVRFAHSEAYLNELAARVGFEVVSHEMANADAQHQVRYSVFRKAG